MNELDAIFESLERQYEIQHRRAVRNIEECSWLSFPAKKAAIRMMSPDSETAQQWFINMKYSNQTYYSYLQDKELWGYMSSHFQDLNNYIKNYCRRVGAYVAYAQRLKHSDNKIAIDALVSAIRLLTEFNAINHYRDIVKMERKRRLNRRKSSNKGGESVAQLYALFRHEAIQLLKRDKSNGKIWKSYKKAVEAIEDGLWQFIEIKRSEGYKTLLKRETLNEAVLRWADRDKELKSAVESVVRKKKNKI